MGVECTAIKNLGAHFGQELAAAGFTEGIGFDWQGNLWGVESLTEEERDQLTALVNAHNPDAPPPQCQFSFLEFMNLFTAAEQLVLVEASLTFPAIKLWYDMAMGAAYIDLNDPRTGTGLQALVDFNLISAERMASVMAGQGPSDTP